VLSQQNSRDIFTRAFTGVTAELATSLPVPLRLNGI
jgi:hypothetical protein